jgi:peptidoglycan/xylan/chitin deacetylase (PgdA/CDA1 family)
MCIALHPFYIGAPHRIKYLDDILGYILSHDGVWKTTADEIAEYYLANYYDQVLAYLEARRPELNPV